jgi:hypothetical protein
MSEVFIFARVLLLFIAIVWCASVNDLFALGDIPEISITHAKFGGNNWVEVKDDGIGFPKGAAGQDIIVKGSYAPKDKAQVNVTIYRTNPALAKNLASDLTKDTTNGIWTAKIVSGYVVVNGTYTVDAAATVGKTTANAKQVTITIAN